MELRIDPTRYPKPDVIATSGTVEGPYPTKAVDVVVEILSENDQAIYLLDKCRAYAEWGFEYIYLVHPDGKEVFRWTGTALALTDTLSTIPASRIWEELEKALKRR